MATRQTVVTLTFLLGSAVHARPIFGQQTESATEVSTLQGVYTDAQARKGEATYREKCGQCHAAAAHAGAAFRRAWTGRTAYDYFDQIRTTMPNDSPKRLSRGQYIDIVAYMFKLNGLPAGEKSLPSDEEKLQHIRIEVQPLGTGSRQPAAGNR